MAAAVAVAVAAVAPAVTANAAALPLKAPCLDVPCWVRIFHQT